MENLRKKLLLALGATSLLFITILLCVYTLIARKAIEHYASHQVKELNAFSKTFASEQEGALKSLYLTTYAINQNLVKSQPDQAALNGTKSRAIRYIDNGNIVSPESSRILAAAAKSFEWIDMVSTIQAGHRITFSTLDFSLVSFEPSAKDTAEDNWQAETTHLAKQLPKILPPKEFKPQQLPVFWNDRTSQWTLRTIHPFQVNNYWVGLLLDDIAVNKLIKIKDNNQIQHFLIDEKGRFILVGPWQSSLDRQRDNFFADFTSAPGLYDIFSKTISNQAKSLSNNVSLHGANYIAVGITLNEGKWKYYRLVNTEGTLSQVWYLVISASIIFTVFALFFYYFLVHFYHTSIALRLKSLQDTINKYALGDWKARDMTSGNDVVADTSTRFNEMAEKIEGHRRLEVILRRLERESMEGNEATRLLDIVCRELSAIIHSPLVWIAVETSGKYSVFGAGGDAAAQLLAHEEHACLFCEKALKNGALYSTAAGNPIYPSAPTGATAIFPLELGEMKGAIIFHAPNSLDFTGEEWEWMGSKSTQLEHVMRLTYSEKKMMEVRLRLLQAQIEPHFLVNTLSNVIALIDVSPETASRMLGLLASYLRVSLARTRSIKTTLGEEIEIVSVYLEIQKLRMGKRLDYSIDVDPKLHTIKFPALLLQPLVENAVQHGIEPAIAGGSVAVSIFKKNEKLILEVNDTGIGFGKSSGHGVGLSNIKERLSRLYGTSAQFNISPKPDQGILARIEISLFELERI